MATTVEESNPPLNKTTALGKELADMAGFRKKAGEGCVNAPCQACVHKA
jgi:hypothetical protein